MCAQCVLANFKDKSFSFFHDGKTEGLSDSSTNKIGGMDCDYE